jgi:hypothetical protein
MRKQGAMKRSASAKDWLPLTKGKGPAAEVPTGEAFRSEWIDFKHGLRIGNLEPHERITQILKFHLELRYHTSFVTDRWGRGVYWQWICWLSRANREAKPVSNKVNFGCAKFFISADTDTKIFKSGLQIERGYAQGPEPYPGCLLKPDWDWHRLIKQCTTGTKLDNELRRLLKHEGFVIEVGNFEDAAVFNAKNFKSARQISDAAKKSPKREWAGFQLYYPMPEKEVRASTGYELVKAICDVFAEVTPAMNSCMTVPLAG